MRESAQLVVLQFDLLPAFLFQIHRIIIAYQLYEAGWNMILVAFVCLRKSKNRNKKGFHCSSVWVETRLDMSCVHEQRTHQLWRSRNISISRHVYSDKFFCLRMLPIFQSDKIFRVGIMWKLSTRSIEVKIPSRLLKPGWYFHHVIPTLLLQTFDRNTKLNCQLGNSCNRAEITHVIGP